MPIPKGPVLPDEDGARHSQSTLYRTITIYFGAMTLANTLGDPTGLVSLPILFILKDSLHLSAREIATFEAIVYVPVYFGFIFGFLRDRWQPFGYGDQAYYFLAAPVAVGCYIWLAVNPITYSGLLVMILTAMIAFQFLDTVTQALMTAIAQRYLMTGRLSALAELAAWFPNIVAVLAGGWLVSHVSARVVFLAAAAFTSIIMLQALWRPPVLFAVDGIKPCLESNRAAIKRLFHHQPFWRVVIILSLWSFSPGWGTPLFFYLTEEVNISSEVFAFCKAVNYACAAAATLAYAFFCRRHSLKTALYWGMLLNIFPGLLYLLIRTPAQAVVIAIPVGLLTGFGYVAITDLLRRSCLKDLEGTATMIGLSMFTLASTTGDLVGSWLYESVGFTSCLVVDAVANLLLVPALLRIPDSLISSRDGELSMDAIERVSALRKAD